MRAKKHYARQLVLLTIVYTTLNAAPLHVLAESKHAEQAMETAWAAYTQAQRQWQQELADFLVSHRPDLKDLILDNRDLQLALADRRSLEFRYLLASHPERIVKDQGVSKFANFDWSEEDSNTLERRSPDYRVAENHVKELRKRVDGRPQGPGLLEAQRGFAKNQEFLKIYERFDGRLKEVEKLLAGSR